MRLVLLLIVVVSSFSSSCKSTEPTAPATSTAPANPTPMKLDLVALPEMNVPPDNPLTVEKVALGKQLFFDTRLSRTGNMSCETCHLPEKGWTDGKTLSPRFDGSMNTRHTPTLYNVGYFKEWYWDGRATTLEGQVLAAWRGQMGGEPEQVATTLNGIDAYKNAFQQAMGGPATPDAIAKALASFVRTLLSDGSPWDRYEKGDKSAVSEDAIKGFDVFTHTDKANCSLCHLPPAYTDTLFHNVGVGFDKPNPDLGRGKILADQGQPNPATNGAFKTPHLRSIVETAPYFHDGQAAKLEEAIDFMLRGGVKNPSLDEKLKPKKLTPAERTQLLEFLKSLTAPPQPFERPQIP